LPSLETLTTNPPPPVVEPCTPPESNVALTPLPFQLPTTHELATPPVLPPDPLPDAVEDPDPDALGVADSLDPLDAQAASPKVSPTATTASLVIRIETPPYPDTVLLYPEPPRLIQAVEIAGARAGRRPLCGH
jgi:hypothetical protein